MVAPYSAIFAAAPWTTVNVIGLPAPWASDAGGRPDRDRADQLAGDVFDATPLIAVSYPRPVTVPRPVPAV